MKIQTFKAILNALDGIAGPGAHAVSVVPYFLNDIFQLGFRIYPKTKIPILA